MSAPTSASIRGDYIRKLPLYLLSLDFQFGKNVFTTLLLLNSDELYPILNLYSFVRKVRTQYGLKSRLTQVDGVALDFEGSASERDFRVHITYIRNGRGIFRRL